MAPDLAKVLAPTCTNGMKDGDETDVDCGGSCAPCTAGEACAHGSDCASGLCTNQQCEAASCTDGLKNAGETDVDCGGGCPGCADGKSCNEGTDCLSGSCANHVCGGAPMPDMRIQPDLSAPPDLSIPCVASLSGIGTSDFSIRFEVQTTAQRGSTLLYQRSTCSGSTFWDVRMNGDGTVVIETDDTNGAYSKIISTQSVNDGAIHSVSIQRVSGVITISVDGASGGTGAANASLGTLPPLGTSSGDPCESSDGTSPLVGSVYNVCLSR